MAILPCISSDYIRSYFLSIIKRPRFRPGGTPCEIDPRLPRFALFASPGAADPIKIKIACTATSDCASAMIATYDGIFAKHGLDAEMTLIGINTNIPPAIASDSIEVGGPTSTVFLQAVDGGLDLVAIAGASVMDPAEVQPHRGRAEVRSDDVEARGFRRQESRRARHRRFPGRAVPQMADRRRRRSGEGQLCRSDVPDAERRAQIRRRRRRGDGRAVRRRASSAPETAASPPITPPTSSAPIRSSNM